MLRLLSMGDWARKLGLQPVPRRLKGKGKTMLREGSLRKGGVYLGGENEKKKNLGGEKGRLLRGSQNGLQRENIHFERDRSELADIRISE